MAMAERIPLPRTFNQKLNRPMNDRESLDILAEHPEDYGYEPQSGEEGREEWENGYRQALEDVLAERSVLIGRD